MRFHHYNQKRMKHLEIIDQFFKQEDSKGEGIHSVLSSKGIPVPLQVPESLKASQSYMSSTRVKERAKEQLAINMTSKIGNVFEKELEKKKKETAGRRLNPALQESAPTKFFSGTTPNTKIFSQEDDENSRFADHLSVPLRVPLDLAYSNGNRKLANVIFKGEMMQKVKEHAV